MLPSILKKRPIIFGDPEVLQALKSLEEKEQWCDSCDGEGMVECSDCRGSGKKDEPSEQPGKGYGI